MNARNFKRGVVIGADESFIQSLLKYWPLCENLILVDVKLSQGFGPVTQHISMHEAASLPNNSIDFVYIDLKSYCAVSDALEVFWRKLRAGGVMSGNDFLNADEAKKKYGLAHADWNVCDNGSWVKGAALDFWSKHSQEVGAGDGWLTGAYETLGTWESWGFWKGRPEFS